MISKLVKVHLYDILPQMTLDMSGKIVLIDVRAVKEIMSARATPEIGFALSE